MYLVNQRQIDLLGVAAFPVHLQSLRLIHLRCTVTLRSLFHCPSFVQFGYRCLQKKLYEKMQLIKARY